MARTNLTSSTSPGGVVKYLNVPYWGQLVGKSRVITCLRMKRKNHGGMLPGCR